MFSNDSPLHRPTRIRSKIIIRAVEERNMGKASISLTIVRPRVRLGRIKFHRRDRNLNLKPSLKTLSQRKKQKGILEKRSKRNQRTKLLTSKASCFRLKRKKKSQSHNRHTTGQNMKNFCKLELSKPRMMMSQNLRRRLTREDITKRQTKKLD